MKTQEQIVKLKTLQESFDNLASSLEKLSNSSSAIALDKEVADGKQSLVDAIEYKGGTSNAEKSLQGIAEDIKEIPNFDQWVRLAGVLAGNSHTKDSLQGHEENVAAGSITKLTDPFGIITTINNYAFQNWDLLEDINLPFVTKVGSRSFQFCTNVRTLSLERLIEITTDYEFANMTNLQIVDFPNVTKVTSKYAFRYSDNISYIIFGKLNSYVDCFYEQKLNIRSITIGQDTNIDLNFNTWKATNVITEGQSGIDELNNNLRTNLLEKLYDHSTDGQTRTLRLGWLAHVTQENIDYANSKGWTLTT